jgi:hypothetical protein
VARSGPGSPRPSAAKLLEIRACNAACFNCFLPH